MTGIVVHRGRHDHDFVVIPNAIAQNRRLSFQARGLLTFLLSVRPGTPVPTAGLAQKSPEGRDAIRTALKELVDAGYAVWITERGPDGRVRRHLEVFDTPRTGAWESVPGVTSQDSGFLQVAPGPGIPASGKPGRKREYGAPKYEYGASRRGRPAEAEVLRRRCERGEHTWECPPATCPEKKTKSAATRGSAAGE